MPSNFEEKEKIVEELESISERRKGRETTSEISHQEITTMSKTRKRVEEEHNFPNKRTANKLIDQQPIVQQQETPGKTPPF